MSGPFKYPGEGPLLNEWAWMGVALLVLVALAALVVGVTFAADCIVGLLA